MSGRTTLGNEEGHRQTVTRLASPAKRRQPCPSLGTSPQGSISMRRRASHKAPQSKEEEEKTNGFQLLVTPRWYMTPFTRSHVSSSLHINPYLQN